MLRITSVTNDSYATLRLEGTLRGPWVAELARACEERTRSTERLSLDLSAVNFVDAAGLELLHGLLQRNVTLAACSALVAELLHTESTLDAPQDAEAIVRLHGGRMLALAPRFL